MTQAAVNEKLSELFERFEQNQLPKLYRQFAKSIDNTRLQVNDMLTDYAKSDGTIPRNRINSLVRELEVIENEIRRVADNEMRRLVGSAAEQAVSDANTALIVGIGVAILASFLGVSASALAVQANARTIETALALGGLLVSTFRRRTISGVLEDAAEDGLTFEERIWRVGGDLRDELAKEIRREAIAGQSINEIMKSVRKVYRDEEWKLKRLVETEARTGYRTAVALGAQKSKAVKGLRIIDHPDGHPRHRTHKCYIYARRNEYGMGRGVYPVTETKILRPHPQCRATLHFVLRDGVIE